MNQYTVNNGGMNLELVNKINILLDYPNWLFYFASIEAFVVLSRSLHKPVIIESCPISSTLVTACVHSFAAIVLSHPLIICVYAAERNG